MGPNSAIIALNKAKNRQINYKLFKINNLKVNYGNHSVLNQLYTEIHSNTIHVLAGLNGSRKTTLLNTVYGLKNKFIGTIQYNDRDIKRKIWLISKPSTISIQE